MERLRESARRERAPDDLLRQTDRDLLGAVGLFRNGRLLRAGLLLAGNTQTIREHFPAYVWTHLRMVSDTDYSDRRRTGCDPLALERILDRIMADNPLHGSARTVPFRNPHLSGNSPARGLAQRPRPRRLPHPRPNSGQAVSRIDLKLAIPVASPAASPLKTSCDMNQSRETYTGRCPHSLRLVNRSTLACAACTRPCLSKAKNRRRFWMKVRPCVSSFGPPNFPCHSGCSLRTKRTGGVSCPSST